MDLWNTRYGIVGAIPCPWTGERHGRIAKVQKMTTLYLDTEPELEQLQIQGLRQMPSWRKVALLAEMSQTVRMLAMAGVRQRFPQDTPAQRRRRLADLMLGPELACQVYGPHGEDPRC